LYTYAFFLFDRGQYAESLILLDIYKTVHSNDDSLISAQWGRLASNILLSNWDNCLKLIGEIKNYIDNPQGDLSYKKQLHQRSWLITWSLFFAFQNEQGINNFLDLTQEERYRQTVQNQCPWMIRYIILAVLAVRSNNIDSLKDIQRLVYIESYQFQDSVTEFVTSLLKNFQFAKAETVVDDVATVLSSDYFITQEFKSNILKNAREMIWKYFLSVHSVCRLDFIAEKLNVSIEEAEIWSRKTLSEINKEFTISEGLIHLNAQSETDQLLSQLSKKFSLA